MPSRRERQSPLTASPYVSTGCPLSDRRFDSYNLANTPIFPGPNTDPTNPALFGTVPACQVNPARTFQLALRLTF